ncbi:unnamed protein product [Rhizoctonia solani]|uniref:BTB domain-containing protein n=1 Tax=Rhizoctonia solani TaxID=456999 RepID=A0A8H3BUH2_9AGAM|nr:unnamed protein product [Rhizoctonia solani]
MSDRQSDNSLEDRSSYLGAFKTSHFYNDGNITFDVRGTRFKVHKSILALYSEVFKDMLGLPCVHPAKGQDEPIPLDDDPKAFDTVLDAIYKGAEFVRKANIVQLMDAIAITHKYQMSHLEDCLQDYIVETMLPCSAADGISEAGFQLYDKHATLATTVLRLGAKELAPWAFYTAGVQLFSKVDVGNRSSYEPPPTWFAFDPEFAFSFFVLRQIINDAFEKWDEIMSEFYTTACPRNNSRSVIKCARQPRTFDQSSPLYIPSSQKRVDPVREMASRIKNLATVWKDQKDSSHSGWCPKCSTDIKDLASSVISDMYPHLVDCVAGMNRTKLRNVSNT